MATLSPSTPHPDLEPFIRAQVFGVSEIHTARSIVSSIFPRPDEVSFLDFFAIAISTWAPLNGHVCANIADLQSQVRSEMKSLDTLEAQQDFDNLQWPTFEVLQQHLQTSPLVHVEQTSGIPLSFDYTKPLVLSEGLLYLTRQFIDEIRVASAIGSRLTERAHPLPDRANQWINDVFKDGSTGLQAEAVRNVLKYPTSVLLGGPGTGKTYTIAGMLHALLARHSESESTRHLRIALAAPTAKAAQQMTASITATLNAVDSAGKYVFPQQHRESIASICSTSSTIHRLLGFNPNNRSRFQHDQFAPLPFDVVIIDEVSMISLPLMARLLEAMPTHASLVLVGDPAQLQSVEAGAVLPQISHLASSSQYPIVTLDKNWRQLRNTTHGTNETAARQLNNIGELASLMRTSYVVDEKDIEKVADDVAAFLHTPREDITFVELPAAQNSVKTPPHSPDPSSESVRNAIAPHLQSFTVAAQCARTGDAQGALDAMNSVRVLCAHRDGKYGVSHWNTIVADAVNVSPQRGSVGQPLLNTRNDMKSGLVNGDTSIVVQLGASRRAAFPPLATNTHNGAEKPEIRLFVPSALEDAEIAFAITVHKSQGSQYDTVIVVVPPVGSPLLQRELLYTAVTRARRHLVLVGTTESIKTAVKTSIQRASGLANRIQQIPNNTPQA